MTKLRVAVRIRAKAPKYPPIAKYTRMVFYVRMLRESHIIICYKLVAVI